jgi:2-haloacid dehalogenase
MLNFNQFKVLTFDCYGTLIDWESGILSTLRPILSRYCKDIDDTQIIKLYDEFERKIQSENEYLNYKEVLKRVIQQFGNKFEFNPSYSELNCLTDSLGSWKAFPDTIQALKELKEKYKIVIISNIDDDLFALTEKHLQIKFDWIITAEQVKSYKPSLKNFEYAIEKINVSPDQILHIAQSVYHDIIPTNSLDLSNVWVNRKNISKFEKSPADLEVPDLKTLVSHIKSY